MRFAPDDQPMHAVISNWYYACYLTDEGYRELDCVLFNYILCFPCSLKEEPTQLHIDLAEPRFRVVVFRPVIELTPCID